MIHPPHLAEADSHARRSTGRTPVLIFDFIAFQSQTDIDLTNVDIVTHHNYWTMSREPITERSLKSMNPKENKHDF
jgi:hypothetical protein